MSASTPARLDPVGRLRLPRRTTTLRAALVAGLLLTAAGVLYAGTGGPPPASACPATPAAAPPTPGAPTPDAPGPATAGPQARLPIPDGRVGVPVPLADPAGLAVLHPGDVVDVLAVPASGGRGSLAPLAAGVPVLAVERGAAALLLALTPDQGHQLVATPPTSSFAVIVHP